MGAYQWAKDGNSAVLTGRTIGFAQAAPPQVQGVERREQGGWAVQGQSIGKVPHPSDLVMPERRWTHDL